MEKTLLKVSGIVALVVGLVWCFTIIGIIIGLPLLVGGISVFGYSNLSDEEIMGKKRSILGWSIFFLCFTFLAGILGLIFYFTMDRKTYNENNDYFDEIRKLDQLRNQGMITDKEYEAKKKQILDI
ncbi:MAG: SHOCT domain-containing protein [Bacilli bacterium]|nr:SHOCT domain-containing protein [Bacilli bacterium]MDD4644283.1 SHOCT domain-containing protein [Bacilli bacterium]